MEILHCKIFADYHQIIVGESYGYFNEDEIDWDEEAISSMLIAKEKYIVISCLRNLNVDFKLELLKTPPVLNPDYWNQIVICTINVSESKIEIFGVSESSEDYRIIYIPNGFYSLIVTYGNLDSVSFDGTEGMDNYNIFIWPSTEIIPKQVLKKWIR